MEHLVVRAHFYFELSTKGVYHLMSLGHNLASEWTQTPEGLEIIKLIRNTFSNHFDQTIYVATESIRIQEVEDGIELCLLAHIQIEVNREELQPNMNEKLSDICEEVCEAYNHLNRERLEANQQYHDAHLLKMFH